MVYSQTVEVLCAIFCIPLEDFDFSILDGVEKKIPPPCLIERSLIYFKNKAIQYLRAYNDARFEELVEGIGLINCPDLLSYRYTSFYENSDMVTVLLDFVSVRLQAGYKVNENFLLKKLISQADKVNRYKTVFMNRSVDLINYMVKEPSFTSGEFVKFQNAMSLTGKNRYYIIIPESIAENVMAKGFRLNEWSAVIQPFYFSFAFAEKMINMYSDLTTAILLSRRFGNYGLVACLEISDMASFCAGHRGYRVEKRRVIFHL